MDQDFGTAICILQDSKIRNKKFDKIAACENFFEIYIFELFLFFYIFNEFSDIFKIFTKKFTGRKSGMNSDLKKVLES